MRYMWNDFKTVDRKGELVLKPLGTLLIDGKVIKPGDQFDADPAFIKRLGPEIARKCKPVNKPGK